MMNIIVINVPFSIWNLPFSLFTSMTSAAKTRPLCGGAAVDRLSNLPCNVVDLILEHFPVHDVARMSILSIKWRDVWVMHPHLVLDDLFFKQLLSKKGSEKDKQAQVSEISRTISNILLVHTGPISEFHLFIPQDLPLHRCVDMDFWIKNISNGVQKLMLFNKPFTAYNIPFYLFSCLQLTHLHLTKCILNPPFRFTGFCNLISVELEDVITADMSFGTQLEKLELMYCTGIKHLGCQFKRNNNLTRLIIIDGGEIDFGWFKCIQKVEFLAVRGVSNSRNELINFKKLFANMPRINTLGLDDFFLKSLEPGAAVLKRPITTLEKLYLVFVRFDDWVHVQYKLCLIRSLPNLRYLYIVLEYKVNSTDDVDLLDFMVFSADTILEKLEIVEICGVVGSRAEFQFIKLLLASTPSLRRIELEKDVTVDPKEELRISRELLQIPRASTSSQIIWN